MPRNRLCQVVATSLVLLACTGEPVGNEDPPADISVALAASVDTLNVGSHAVFTATVKGADGAPVAMARVIWSSNDTTVATVTDQGQGRSTVTAVAVGRAVIRARSGETSDSARVTVQDLPSGGPEDSLVASLTIQPPPEAVVVGSKHALVATARTNTGRVMPDIRPTWSSSAPSVISVSSGGTIAAVGVGEASITARVSAVSASILVAVHDTARGNPQDSMVASMVITPPSRPLLIDETLRLTVTGRDATGRTLSNLSPEWSSSLPSVVGVSSDGWVAARGFGKSVITARIDAVSASVEVTSTASELRVTPQGVQVAPGDSLKLTVRPVGVNGNSGVPLPPLSGVAWSSSAPDLISVTPSGWAVAHQGGVGGAVLVTATFSGVTGDRYLNVAPFPAGLPARVRYAYGGGDLGAFTAIPTKGSPVPLHWGEVVEQLPGSGTLQVWVDGLPAQNPNYPTPDFSGLLPPDRTLTLYAAGIAGGTYPAAGTLIPVWDERPAVAADSAMLRLVMASWYAKSYIGNNIYVLPAGAPIDDFPLFCYFDIGATSPYLRIPPGAYDIVIVDPETFVLVPGHPGHEYIRFRVTPEMGRATTYAIIGNDSTTMRLITTVEP